MFKRVKVYSRGVREEGVTLLDVMGTVQWLRNRRGGRDEEYWTLLDGVPIHRWDGMSKDYYIEAEIAGLKEGEGENEVAIQVWEAYKKAFGEGSAERAARAATRYMRDIYCPWVAWVEGSGYWGYVVIQANGALELGVA